MQAGRASAPSRSTHLRSYPSDQQAHPHARRHRQRRETRTPMHGPRKRYTQYNKERKEEMILSHPILSQLILSLLSLASSFSASLIVSLCPRRSRSNFPENEARSEGSDGANAVTAVRDSERTGNTDISLTCARTRGNKPYGFIAHAGARVRDCVCAGGRSFRGASGERVA